MRRFNFLLFLSFLSLICNVSEAMRLCKYNNIYVLTFLFGAFIYILVHDMHYLIFLWSCGSLYESLASML